MNRLASTAVMARRVEPAGSLDFFPTPPWGTRAFCEHVLPQVWPQPDRFNCAAWDPACGEGHMAVALDEYFGGVYSSDIFDYGMGHVSDFCHPEPQYLPEIDWIITNPPFNRAIEFVETARKWARRGVAVLARTQFAEGQERWKRLFRGNPPAAPVAEAIFAERLPMHRGRWVIDGSTASSYAWFVWLTNPSHDRMAAGTRRLWIPPCRAALSRHDDWLRFGGCQDLPRDHPAVLLASRAAPPAGPAAKGAQQEALL